MGNDTEETAGLWDLMAGKVMVRFFWKLLGFTSLLLGIIGIFLPLLPTTPFLILSAFAFERGSEAFHQWLISHPKFGPAILNWQQHGAISKRAKFMAVIAMAAVFILSVVLQVPTYALILQAIILCCVAIFLLTRPEPPTED